MILQQMPDTHQLAAWAARRRILPENPCTVRLPVHSDDPLSGD